MEREQVVRELAYAIWESGGCPQGYAEEHWCQAEAQIDANVAQAKPAAAPNKVAPAKVVKEIAEGSGAKAAKNRGGSVKL